MFNFKDTKVITCEIVYMYVEYLKHLVQVHGDMQRYTEDILKHLLVITCIYMYMPGMYRKYTDNILKSSPIVYKYMYVAEVY